MKTIIAATDFSPNAENAILYAGALAASTKARLVLFNAFQLPVHTSDMLLSAEEVDTFLQSQKERLEEIAFQKAEKFGIAVAVQVKTSFLAQALEETVLEWEADLVVMGMHLNDWNDRVFGNTTTAIIRTARYPVLIVPETATFNGIKRILYAYDPACLYSHNKLSIMKELSCKFNAEVQVLHVQTSHTEVVENTNTFKKLSLNIEHALTNVAHTYKAIEETNVIEGIEKGIQEFSAGLLVMVPHKLSVLKNLLNQSTTRAMALRTQIPLLVLPNTTLEKYN